MLDFLGGTCGQFGKWISRLKDCWIEKCTVFFGYKKRSTKICIYLQNRWSRTQSGNRPRISQCHPQQYWKAERKVLRLKSYFFQWVLQLFFFTWRFRWLLHDFEIKIINESKTEWKNDIKNKNEILLFVGFWNVKKVDFFCNTKITW